MKHIYMTTALIALGFATTAMAAKDNFNRAALGSKWVAVSGTQGITSNRFTGSTLSLGYDKKSKTSTTVTTTVYLGGTDLEYGAVASGDIASGGNAFAKIQAQNADGMFSNAAFYTGNNGGGDFFSLSSEVPSPATITLSFCGTVATLKITSSAKPQVYNYDYGTTFGTGGGLGTYGSVALDNYKSRAGGCALHERGIMIKHGASTVRDLSQAK
jgi:hypothetical protein